MKPFTFEQWHVWQGSGQIIVSDEESKTLRYYANTDDAINWLFLKGYKTAARALNAHVKGA